MWNTNARLHFPLDQRSSSVYRCVHVQKKMEQKRKARISISSSGIVEITTAVRISDALGGKCSRERQSESMMTDGVESYWKCAALPKGLSTGQVKHSRRSAVVVVVQACSMEFFDLWDDLDGWTSSLSAVVRLIVPQMDMLLLLMLMLQSWPTFDRWNSWRLWQLLNYLWDTRSKRFAVWMLRKIRTENSCLICISKTVTPSPRSNNVALTDTQPTKNGSHLYK